MFNPYKDAFSHETQTNGHLPHWNQNWKYQFVTFRLGDSIPVSVINKYLLDKKEWLESHPTPWDTATALEYEEMFNERVEKYLDCGFGDCVLRDITVADILSQKLLEKDHVDYQMIMYVVMPNHVHVLMRTFEKPLKTIVKSWKGGSALEINRLLGRNGSLWQKESFDRMIRDEAHYNKVSQYIYNNYLSGGVIFYQEATL